MKAKYFQLGGREGLRGSLWLPLLVLDVVRRTRARPSLSVVDKVSSLRVGVEADAIFVQVKVT